jgi:putative ABC transport system ATP-binding protein
MDVALNNIIPEFLEKEKIEHSEIWGQKLHFNQGEKIHIIAPSGSGKTSLVHFLYGLRKDFTGEIILNNCPIKSFTPSRYAEMRSREMSIIFQDLRLFTDHTAYQNISVKRSLCPYHKSEKIYEMADRLGIKSKLNQVTGQCSYGEQQRIAIIRSLQQPFSILLMDEPFSNLDENNRKKAMELIMEESNIRKASVILFDLDKNEYFKNDRLLYL